MGGQLASEGGAGGADAEPSCKGAPPACSTLSNLQCFTVNGCEVANECTGAPAACATHLSKPTCAQAEGCDNGSTCRGTPTPCTERATAVACDNGCTWTPCGGTAIACAGLKETACSLQPGCRWE